MFVSVKERTREIGIRKALGATPWSTISMILKESIALTAGAGYLGLVASVAALELVGSAVSKLPNAPLREPEIDLEIALLATLVLMFSGAVAGLVPARHAASISPVEALRSE
jgi:putative ABC transport system permease protein